MHASPTSTSNPICVNTLLSPRVIHTPAIAESSVHRDNEDDHERQRPALVLRGEHQEHEQHAERKDEDRRVARELLLVRQLRPVALMPLGSVSAAMRSMIATASPELTPGAALPLMSAAG